MSEERIATLRAELKTWEKQFSIQHGGKRPSREDIKNNVEIAAQYKEYDRLRRPPAKQSESQHAKPTKTLHATPRKAAAPTATPQKPSSQFLIPSVPAKEEDVELEPTPAAIRMHLGPTPLQQITELETYRANLMQKKIMLDKKIDELEMKKRKEERRRLKALQKLEKEKAEKGE
ncbi:hypothetical protein D6D25_01244 [Aureobasidium pullulans]|nr:hypothetical protein D6D25_01244 [Aureobasidium pullulans]